MQIGPTPLFGQAVYQILHPHPCRTGVFLYFHLMVSNQKSPPIICTDDAWFIIAADPPLTVETLREKLLPMYLGTPAALWWAIGDHEVYHHETQIGEIFGAGYDDIEAAECCHSMHSEHPGAAHKTVENIRHLLKTAGGPLTALINTLPRSENGILPKSQNE